MPNIDKDVSQRFWSAKATAGSNRWTSTEMFEFEVGFVGPYAEHARQVLDLGSGRGELSRSLVKAESQLTAVDWIDAFSESFDQPNQQFFCTTVTDYQPMTEFDLILLFGVVTYMSAADELMTYAKCAEALTDGGTFIVKNQCAREAEFTFNGFSEALDTQYSGRYPNSEEQLSLLRRSFSRVESVRYPSEFNPWPNSFHVAFVCSEPIR